MERVNILLLGVDLRCDEEGPTHSDTIMVATIDPVSRSAALLSLPRDLWVEIPNYGVNRINQGYFLGQAYEYPGGGPALAVETVEAFLGIPIDYHIAVDFKAVIDFVDLMGGIVVDVPERIDDQNYPDNCYGPHPGAYISSSYRLPSPRNVPSMRVTPAADSCRGLLRPVILNGIPDFASAPDLLDRCITPP